jgi:integrase
MQTAPSLSQHTFAEQSAAWIHELESRKRKPVSPATLAAFNSYVRRLLLIVGPATCLADVDNGFVRELVTKLVAEKLSPKTIAELVATVKQIVASAVNANGNHLFPRQWNSKFIDMPQVQNQKQPCASKADVERCINNSRNDQERLLYALLAGTGFRISEALAIRIQGTDQQTSWSPETASIKVRSTMWRHHELIGHTKSTAGARDIDLDPRLHALIGEFVAENNIQTGQLLFQSRTGGCMNLKTATERLKKHGVKGFHAFRRFRITRLRERAIPEDVVRYWAGHGGQQSISDRYSKLAQNLDIRKRYAGSDEAGLGFDIRVVGTPGAPPPNRTQAVKPTKSRKQSKSELRTQLVVSEIAEPYTSPYVGVDSDLPEIFFSAEGETP